MREVVVRAIPKNLKVSITVVVGFLITYLGLSNSGIGDFSACPKPFVVWKILR